MKNEEAEGRKGRRKAKSEKRKAEPRRWEQAQKAPESSDWRHEIDCHRQPLGETSGSERVKRRLNHSRPEGREVLSPAGRRMSDPGGSTDKRSRDSVTRRAARLCGRQVPSKMKGERHNEE